MLLVDEFRMLSDMLTCRMHCTSSRLRDVYAPWPFVHPWAAIIGAMCTRQSPEVHILNFSSEMPCSAQHQTSHWTPES